MGQTTLPLPLVSAPRGSKKQNPGSAGRWVSTACVSWKFLLVLVVFGTVAWIVQMNASLLGSPQGGDQAMMLAAIPSPRDTPDDERPTQPQDTSNSSSHQDYQVMVVMPRPTQVQVPGQNPTPRPSPATFSAEPKECVKLDHRDPTFIQDDTLCLSRHEVQSILKQIVITLADLFEKHNVTFFLESGTLLGSYRNNGLIPHDGDADFGIDEKALTYLQNTPVYVPPEFVVTVWNSELYGDSTRDDKLPIRLVHKETALYADVFVFLNWTATATDNDTDNTDEQQQQPMVGPLPSVCFSSCVSCTRISQWERHLKVPYDWVYPLVDCTFENRTYKCPRETEKYLSFMYGAGFKWPQKWS